MNVPVILGNGSSPPLINDDVSFCGEKIIPEDIYRGEQDVSDVLKNYFDFGSKVCRQYQEKKSEVLLTKFEEVLRALDKTVKTLVTEFDNGVDLERIKTHVIQPVANFVNNCVQTSRDFHVQNICLDKNPLFPKMIHYFQTDIQSDYLNLMESTFFTISSYENIIGLHLNLVQEFALIFPIVKGFINQSDAQCNIEPIAQNLITSTARIIKEMKTVREESYFTSKNMERFFFGQERDPLALFEKLMTHYSGEKDPKGQPYNYSVSVGMPLTFSYQAGTAMTEDVNFVKITGGFVIRDSGISSAECLKFQDLHTETQWHEILGSITGTHTPNEGPELIDLIGHHFYSYGCKTYNFFVLREIPGKNPFTPEEKHFPSAGSMKYDSYIAVVWAEYLTYHYYGIHHLEIIYY